MKAVVALFVVWLASPCGVATAAESTLETNSAVAGTTADTMTDAEVRKVDKDAQKLTLRHGAIANLDMPAMTMVFRVSDPALLDNVKVGDKVRFHAEKVGGQLTVTRIEANHG